MALTLCVAAFAIARLAKAAHFWCALTTIAAALAATRDVFVDAFAVRVRRPSERGFGNTAQVAGYRLGMLIGGAALLLLVDRLGERATLLGCAALVAIASARAVIGLALTFKLGLHMASSLLKPMARDFGWSKERIAIAPRSRGARISTTAGSPGPLRRRDGR